MISSSASSASNNMSSDGARADAGRPGTLHERFGMRLSRLSSESKSTGDFLVRLRDGRELAGSRRYRRPLLAD